MAQKDINVRIKADADKASRNARDFAKALKQIGVDGNAVAKTTATLGSGFGAMSADLAKLQEQATRTNGLGRIVADMERASASVATLEKQLERGQKSFAAFQASSRANATASDGLRAKVEQEVRTLALRERLLESNTEKLKAQKKVVDELTRAEAVLNGKRRKGVSVTDGAVTESRVSSAIGATKDTIGTQIRAAQQESQKLQSTVEGLSRAVRTSKTALSEMGAEANELANGQKYLERETMEAGNAVLKTREALHSAKKELRAYEDEALTANAALGTLAFTQDDVAKAAARAEDEIRQQTRALEAYNRLSTQRLRGGGTIADTTRSEQSAAQSEAIRKAREEVTLLQGEQAKLDAAMRSASGNISQQVDAYDRMTRAVKLAEENVRKLEIQQRRANGVIGANNLGSNGFGAWIRSSQQASAAQQVLVTSTRATAMRQQAQSTNQASAALDGFGRNTRTTLSFMQRMRGEVLALTSGFLGFYAAINRASEALQTQRRVQNAETRLSVAFDGDMQRVGSEMEWLRSESERLGFTLTALATGYSKMSVAAQNAGFSVRDTRELFTSITESSRVMGSSVDEISGILKAFEQILNKGKLSAEELNGQLGDRGLPAFKIFADALGLTTQELTKLMEKGEVFADRDTMMAAAKRLTQIYSGQLPKAFATTGFAMDMFAVNMEKVNLLLAEGMKDAIIEASAAFGRFVNSDSGEAFFRSVGDAAGWLISVLAQIPDYMGLITTSVQALLALGFARAILGIYNSLKTAGTGFIAYSEAAKSASIQAGRFTLAQRTLMQGVLRADVAIGSYERNLRASVASNRRVSAGTLAWVNTLGFLRTAMLGVAGVARAMWAAIGGPVGIAIAGVGLVIANWKTDADRATEALAQHERQLQLVRKAYQDAGGDAKKFVVEVQKLTTEAQATDQLDKLTKAYNNMLSSIVSRSRLARAAVADIAQAIPDDPRVAQGNAIAQLAEDLESGARSFEEVEKALSDIALNALDDDLKSVALEMLEMMNTSKDGATSLKDLGQAVQESAAYLRLIKDEAESGDEALLGLGDTVEETTKSFEDTKALDAYASALDDLKSKIPSLADEMKRLKDQTELNTSAWLAFVAAVKTGDLSKIGEVWSLWTQGLTDQNNAYAGSPEARARYRADYTIQRGTASGAEMQSLVTETARVARALGVSTQDLLAAMSFETGGSFRTDIMGGAGGQYLGIIQFSPDNQKKYGLTQQSGIKEQLDAVEDYLRSTGVRPGDTLMQIYAAILSGSASKINASDVKNGGVVSSVSEAVTGPQFEGHIARAEALQEVYGTLAEGEVELAENARRRSDETQFQIRQAELQNQKLDRQAAVEAALRDALLEKRRLLGETATLTAEETANVERQAAALWDANNPRYELLRVEEQLAQLEERRNALIEQREMAIEQGDTAKAAALKIEIEGLNVELQKVIDKAIAMWQAIGGPEAEAGIAILQSTSMGVKSTNAQIGAFGLSMDTWFNVFQTGINGIVGIFDSFAQAIANGENAWQAFGNAALRVLAQVLQQIAAAIIQQQILNMLAGGSFGGTMASFATRMLGGGMVGHTGGVVGSMAIGGGNARIGRPDWVNSAFTYHTGGRAGFAPDEVSATLKKGEEILTEEDPRHRDNMGGAGPASDSTRLKQVLAIGDDEIANAMRGAAGESVMMTTIKRNAPTIRRLLGT